MAGRPPKQGTKNRIINSARELFAEQGYVKTTVADISRHAGLSEAALYEYFQGKEDLLLTIPRLWVSELLAGLEEQMFGIKGAVNKLRKYLWWYLRRVEMAPLDAKIVYLFLKTNAKFMESEVYADVRSFYSQLLVILEEGKANGEIKPDLNSRLARDIFVGAMDHLITRWLLKERSYSLFENLEEVFDLLVNALGWQEKAKPAPERISTGQSTERESPQAEPVVETEMEPNSVEA